MTLLLFENHFTLQLIMFDFAEFEKKNSFKLEINKFLGIKYQKW